MKINLLTILSLVINSLITMVLYASGEYKGLDLIMLIALLVSLVGLIIMQFINTKVGSVIFIIGCVGFVPIGMIGIVGARKTVEKLEAEKFNKENYE